MLKNVSVAERIKFIYNIFH